MKYLILVFCCISVVLLRAQHVWELQNPKPHGLTLNAVVLPSQDCVIAVGDNGVVQRSTDGGATWDIEYLGTENLTAVSFIDSLTGWISSFSETYYVTTDGGKTWTAHKLLKYDMIYDIHFENPQLGWACTFQGALMRTRDGGESWDMVKWADTRSILKLNFLNADTGWAITSPNMVLGGNPQIFKTTDAGSTWTTHTLSDAGYLSDIYFFNADSGMALSSMEFLFRTADGGETWQPDTLSVEIPGFFRSLYFRSIQFSDRNHGWITTDWTIALRTDDAGVSWQPVLLNDPIEAELTDAFFTNPLYGWMVGAGGQIYVTADGGETWQPHFHGSLETFSIVRALSEQTVFAAGEKSVYRTLDGGLTWDSVITFDQNISDMVFLNDQLGWITVDGFNTMKTTDGGDNWEPVNQLAGKRLGPCFFPDEQTGWIIGGAGLGDSTSLYKTIDGGTNWDIHKIPGNGVFKDMTFVSADSGWICGNSSLLFRTVDGGETWQPQDPGVRGDLYCIEFTDSKTGWMGGTVGQFFLTTDGGETWTVKRTDNYHHLRDLKLFDAQSAWFCTTGGDVIYTENAGESWRSAHVADNRWLYGIDFASPDVGWVVGEKGLIKKTTNGRLVRIESEKDEVAQHFALLQAYPNPFNPSTKISVTLDRSTSMQLEIFNILGARIAVLHDAFTKAGSYDFTWNAAFHPSGIYLIRLTAGEEMNTVKLLLQK